MADAPFRDNVVILTGASAGIGREMALRMAAQGAHLALAARDAAARPSPSRPTWAKRPSARS